MNDNIAIVLITLIIFGGGLSMISFDIYSKKECRVEAIKHDYPVEKIKVICR